MLGVITNQLVTALTTCGFTRTHLRNRDYQRR